MAQSQVSELQLQRQPSGKLDFEHLEISDALKQLGADPKSGLSDTEAKKRLEEYGPNALPEKKVSAFGKFFWGAMPWMIEAPQSCRRKTGGSVNIVRKDNRFMRSAVG